VKLQENTKNWSKYMDQALADEVNSRASCANRCFVRKVW